MNNDVRGGEPQMTDAETAAYLREWVKQKKGSVWSWPTDACGYDQHIKFVKHRNANWHGGDFDQFVLDYANQLEQQVQRLEQQR